MKRLLVLLAFLALGAPALPAQVVETPVPFDSAGRVMVVTPGIAARLQLLPPAWRVTGDYEGARLFRLSDQAYVLVVTRRSGAVERYSLTGEDRAYLRVKTSTLPPDLETQLREGTIDVVRGIRRGTRNAFVRNQSVLGLTIYAPSFTAAVTNDEEAMVATYLLVSGASYFGASVLARDIEITPTMNGLATGAAIRGGLAGWGLGYALDMSNDGTAAGIFVGSLAGTAGGLYFGRNMTDAQVASTGFASSALALVTGGTLAAIHEGPEEIDSRAAVGAIVGAGLLGYPIGAAYPRFGRHNVTAGDVATLWTTAVLGAMAGEAYFADDDVDASVQWTAGTLGFVGGIIAGDRLLVRRFDHTPQEANLLALGAAAGALMAPSIYALVDPDAENVRALLALGTVGGIAGVALSEYFLIPRVDAGRISSRLRVMPGNLALAAAGIDGRHPLLSVSF